MDKKDKEEQNKGDRGSWICGEVLAFNTDSIRASGIRGRGTWRLYR